MSQEAEQNPIAKKKVVYEVPGMESVTVRRGVEYAADSGSLTMDLYYPPDFKPGSRLPAVVIVSGYRDEGTKKVLGCTFKEMGWTVSWARLAAASALVAVTYTNRDPAADVRALLRHLRENAAKLGIDESKIGVLACSGHVPIALSLLMRDTENPVTCAVLYYGYTLDLQGSTGVADASRQFGFVDACAGKSVDDLSPDIPLFVARAGRDEIPNLKESLDRFLADTLACNLPVTLVNHAGAPHAFDLFDDGEMSREIVERTLHFLRFHLLS